MSEERLQKLIARTGRCSRREAEELIREGRVTVNGHRASLGDKADPAHDHIKIDGKVIRRKQTLRYLLLYKPREVVTTCEDPEERTTVIDLIKADIRERVFPVGRLDYHSEGLLILTNDGDLAARITHPRYGVVREYLVKIKGDLRDDELARLLRGTSIEGHFVKPLSARRESRAKGGSNTWWRVEVAEGRTHEVRELFFRTGHHVQRLKRTAIGPIRDPYLRPGQLRDLDERELAALKRGVKRPPEPKQQPRQRPGQRPGQRPEQPAKKRPGRPRSGSTKR